MKTRKDIDTLPIGAKCPNCGILQKYQDVTRHKKGCAYTSEARDEVKPSHTPTPITADNLESMLDFYSDRKFIVRAVNSHEALLLIAKCYQAICKKEQLEHVKKVIQQAEGK